MAKIKKENRVVCPICATVNDKTSAPFPFCMRCGTDLGNPSETVILKNYNASYGTGDRMVAPKTGTACLTNKRFVVVPQSNYGAIGAATGGMVGSLIGAAIDSKAKKTDVISMALEDIVAVQDSRFGLLAKAITLEAKDGSTVKVGMSKINQWKEAIENGRNAR